MVQCLPDLIVVIKLLGLKFCKVLSEVLIITIRGDDLSANRTFDSLESWKNEETSSAHAVVAGIQLYHVQLILQANDAFLNFRLFHFIF